MLSPDALVVRARQTRRPGHGGSNASEIQSPEPDSAQAPPGSGAPVARTDVTGTTFVPNWRTRPNAAEIAAHEAVHRAQFDNFGVRPLGDGRALEHEANIGAVASLAGEAFTPGLAASPGMSLAFGPEDWMPDAVSQGGREQAALSSAGLNDDESDIRVGVESYQEGANSDVLYETQTVGIGPGGSIDVSTRIGLSYRPDATVALTYGPMLRPTGPESGMFNAVDVPAYPYVLRYSRRMRYRDEAGREAVMFLDGEVYLTDQQVYSQVLGVQPSIDVLLAIIGDQGGVGVQISGHGDKVSFFRDHLGQEASASSQLLGSEVGLSAGYRYDVPIPASLLDLTATGGDQFTDMRAWIIALDAMALLDPIEDWAGAGNRVSQDPTFNPDASTLDGFLGSVMDLWDSLPGWARGILKAIGMFAGVFALMAAAAGIIVLVAAALGTSWAFGTVMLVLGAIALALGLLYNVWVRFWEWWEHGGPLGFFAIGFVAVLDTLGLGGIIEAVTDQSILTGRDLERSEEDRWEAGTTGALQLVGLFIAARGMRGGTRPVAAELQTRGSMADFHSLPPERLPTNMPEGFGWQRTNGRWQLMTDPDAPPVEVEISVFSDGAGRVNYNVAVEGRPVHSDAITRPVGEPSPGGSPYPYEYRGTGRAEPANPMRDPVTGRVYDKGHGIDQADRTPGARSSNVDPANITPQAGWWNSGVRNPLVGRIRSGGGGYREMPIYDAVPPRTVPTARTPDGVPIPREFVFVETTSAGQPVAAWRIPNSLSGHSGGLAVLPRYSMPLTEIPPVMLTPSGGLRPPGVRFGPIFITGETGDDESVVSSPDAAEPLTTSDAPW